MDEVAARRLKTWLIVLLLCAVPIVVGAVGAIGVVNAPQGRSSFTIVHVSAMDGDSPCFEFRGERLCISRRDIQNLQPGHDIELGDCLSVELSENWKLRSARTSQRLF